MSLHRRDLLVAGLGLAVSGRATATPAEMEAAVAAFTGDAPLHEGKVGFEIAPLVENGNTVPITLSVDSPMSAAEHVQAIAVFNGGNPQPQVAEFHLGPRAGKAVVNTRIRLATSQQLTAVARLSDGSHWTKTVEVVVTLAACVEG
ncbi:SoxY-related AACIE arm protein [uncultured Piscinibacter sp.]|uniref:SoxY-related AACIE arm protein n=1 Tax=uncultured Piscinibacter sp. TaxID=1131835 RepID=UPI002617EFCD|nr:SoxY-related AACIE arm protein [uncultured Piscinibacter sp.]